MKNLKHYYFLLILVIFAQALSAQCPTSNFVRLKRQGQIDSFSINYPNCTNIPGSVVISTSNAYGCPSDIVNLDGLSQIESIHGNLVFRGTQLTNIDGLNNLTQVDGDLKIDYSCELARIDGLNGLLNINGDCKVSNCPKLSQISGFQNLKTIGKNLVFYGNYGLQGIDGFNSLYKINGHFEITNNGIENIGGFGQLTDIEGLLRIENNSNLVKIDGMINLTKIGRTLRLVRCPKLEEISGLENLGSVGENSSTYSYSEITNTHLSNLAGLIGLESIYGSLKIKGNDFLESLDGLENLTLTQKIMIENNRVLIDINGLENVNPLLLKSISISDNPALNDCAIVPICTLLNQPNVSFFVVFNGIGCENLHNISVSCNGGICEEISGFTWLGSYGGHGYYISDETFPWQQAKTLAENAGGYLTTMNDQAENDFLKNQLNGNMVFIGYNDETTEGIGQWADNEPVTLDLSYGNSDVNDYGVMNFWDGGWQMTNGLGYRRFVLEKECGGVLLEHLNVIDFSCQSSFPTLDTAFEVTVTIKNEGGTPSLEKPLYFGQEYDFYGENMKTLGHFDVPALMPNETITLTKSFDISDAQLPGTYSVWPHLIDIAKTYTYGDFIVGFHSSYAPLSQYKYLDFYCKKFNTELSVEILGDTNSLDENGIFDYSLMVSNTGNETAYNVKVEYIEGLGNWPVLNSLFSRYNTSDHAYIYIPVLLAGESKQIHVEQKINDYNYPIPKEEHHISVVVSSGHNTNTLMATDTSSATFHLNPLDCGSIAGFTKLGEYNDHTYYQSNESAPWQQAKTLAENAGGYLATMNDQAENDFLKNQLNGNMVFIGYNDATTEGFGQWADNEPVTLDLSYGNSDINDYGVMNFWDGGWQMTNGLGYRKFVMEKECGDLLPADVKLVSVLCSQGYPYPDSTITLDIVVTNLGGVPSDSVEILFNQRASCSTSTVWAEYFINFGQFDVPSLNPMDTLVLTKSFTMTDVKVPGKYSPGCGHNGSGVWTYDDFTVGDLTLDYYCKKYSTDLSLKVESDSYVYGDDKEIHYDVTVTNNGLDTAYNFWVNTKGGSFYYRDANFGWENIYSLAPGASKTFMSHKKINWNHSPYTLSLNIYAGHNIDPNPGNDSVEVVFYYAGTLCDTVQGFTELGYYDNHTYYLSDASAPWQQAKTLAENAGGYLATMNDQAENDFLKSKLGNNMVFIGYHDENTEGIGQWADNEPVTLDLSYENSDINDYGVMNFWDGTWQMVNQWVAKKYVMEMNCGTPQPAPITQSLSVAKTVSIHDVYPNPAMDNITIRIITPEEKSSLFNVYDGRGQLLLSEKRDLPQGASEVEFDLSDLPAGMYFVKEAGASKYYNFVIMR